MNLLHRWRDVHPNGRKPPHGVQYQQCARDGCDARRVVDSIRSGYRGGAASEAEWVRTGVMPEIGPPPRGPRSTGGVPLPTRRVNVHIYHHRGDTPTMATCKRGGRR